MSMPYRDPATRRPEGFSSDDVRVSSPSFRIREVRSAKGGTFQLRHTTSRVPARVGLYGYVLMVVPMAVIFDDEHERAVVAFVACTGPILLMLLATTLAQRFLAWRSPDEELSITPLGLFWQDCRGHKESWRLDEVLGITADASCVRVHLRAGRTHAVGLCSETGDDYLDTARPLPHDELKWLADQLRRALEHARHVS